MKRVVALGFVSLLLAFGLFACSNNEQTMQEETIEEGMTQEEMLATAQELDAEEVSTFISLSNRDKDKVREEYEGNIYKYTAFVDETLLDEVTIGIPGDPTASEQNIVYLYRVYVELPKETVETLNRGDEITVVGTMKLDESGMPLLSDAFIVNE